ncbi:MAG: FAD binding domain-containing protein [Spirochaetaceae bacterium]
MYRKLDYVAPEGLAEVFSALTGNAGAQVLAGGTDLLPELREKVPEGTLLVDIKRCEGALRGLEERGDGSLWIGALTTIRDLQESEVLRRRYPALTDAADVFGCLEIRYRATIGGNVAHASPGAEYGTPLFVYEAEVEIAGPKGNRTVPIAEFWLDVGKTSLERGEILSGFVLPPLPETALSRYERISRTKGMDLAAMGITVLVFDPEDEKKRKLRIALGAVERTPVRMGAAERALSGRKIGEELMEEVKRQMAEAIHPRATSLRAGPEYKKAMAGILTERILHDFGLYGEE